MTGGPRGRRQRSLGTAVHAPPSGLDPFQILTAEHALIRLQVARSREAARDDPGGPGARRALAALADGFGLHRLREDRVVYPVCERLFGGQDGAASVLRADHAHIDRAFEALLAEPVRPGPASLASLDDLTRLVQNHFSREERVLFPLMRAHLADRERAELARRLRADAAP